MDPIELRQTIRDLVEPSLSRAGFDLVAVEWLGSRRGPTLRLSVEKPGGVTADDCAKVTARISPLLDEADPIPGRYVLEVSSPGIERPVQRREDFARFEGYGIKIRLVEGPPRRRYQGVLGPVNGDDVTITVDGAEHVLSLDTIERAHLVLTLEEYQQLAETES
jgi:ribosome maturation factor RimP